MCINRTSDEKTRTLFYKSEELKYMYIIVLGWIKSQHVIDFVN